MPNRWPSRVQGAVNIGKMGGEGGGTNISSRLYEARPESPPGKPWENDASDTRDRSRSRVPY